MTDGCGEAAWAAPEMLRNERYSIKVDVYSFAIVLWELFAKRDPYPGVASFDIIYGVARQSLRPAISPHWPEAWVSFMESCWDDDPDNRPNFDQILQTLESLPEPTQDHSHPV